MPPIKKWPSSTIEQPALTLSDVFIQKEVARRVDAGNFNPISLSDIDPVKEKLQGRAFDIAEIRDKINVKLKLEKAKKMIMENWAAEGGPGSPLGLPVDPTFRVESAGGGYMVPFRGGNIHLDGNLNTLNTDLGPVCRLTFEGLILYSRQETSQDEIYGEGGYRISSILMRDKVMSGAFSIPKVALGGKGLSNTRVWNTSQEIYKGPPVGIEILLNLAEEDSGGREKVRSKVKALIDEAAKNAGAALSSGIAGESLAQAAQASEDMGQSTWRDFLRSVTADLVTDLFGLSDDPYNPGGLTIPAEDMATPPRIQTAGHPIDNKTIAYTHKIDMTGKDDSGAVGNCSAYFRVWR